MDNQLVTRELSLQNLFDDLMSGLSWFKKDDRGVGSIQEKYEATELQIKVIKQHPKLKDIEEVKFFFVVKDDTEVEEKA